MSQRARAFVVMSAIALFATANTVLIILIVASRMIYGMARDGSFPSLLSNLSTRGSPWIAVLIMMILPCFFVLVGNMGFVAEITNFGTFMHAC